MKAFYISLSLVALATLSQAVDTQASADKIVEAALQQPGTRVTFDSGFDTSFDISELQFRARFLERLESDIDAANIAEDTAAGDCSSQKDAVTTALKVADQAISNISPQETSNIVENAKKLLAQTKIIVEGAIAAAEPTDSVIEASTGAEKNKIEEQKQLGIALVAFNQMLDSLIKPGESGIYVDTLTTLSENLNSVQDHVQGLFHCLASTSRLLLEDSHCGMLADFYRTSVEAAIKSNQEVTPTTPSKETEKIQDLTRLMTGSRTLLDLMSMTSISSSNEGLLATRPIFAADVLDQFRDELLQVGETDEIKAFAQLGLGQVVGASNALEACLRIAADPVMAIDELNEELDLQNQLVYDGDDEGGSEDDRGEDPDTDQ